MNIDKLKEYAIFINNTIASVRKKSLEIVYQERDTCLLSKQYADGSKQTINTPVYAKSDLEGLTFRGFIKKLDMNHLSLGLQCACEEKNIDRIIEWSAFIYNAEMDEYLHLGDSKMYLAPNLGTTSSEIKVSISSIERYVQRNPLIFQWTIHSSSPSLETEYTSALDTAIGKLLLNLPNEGFTDLNDKELEIVQNEMLQCQNRQNINEEKLQEIAQQCLNIDERLEKLLDKLDLRNPCVSREILQHSNLLSKLSNEDKSDKREVIKDNMSFLPLKNASHLRRSNSDPTLHRKLLSSSLSLHPEIKTHGEEISGRSSQTLSSKSTQTDSEDIRSDFKAKNIYKKSSRSLRAWLEFMINSRKWKGLHWENRSEITFRIPWHHFKNKEEVQEDCEILREWAMYTGIYQYDQEEYLVWEIALDCALKTNPEIEELTQMHYLEDANPYRVYKFVNLPSNIEKDYNYSHTSKLSPAVQTGAARPNYFIGSVKKRSISNVELDDKHSLIRPTRHQEQKPHLSFSNVTEKKDQLKVSGIPIPMHARSRKDSSPDNYSPELNVAKSSFLRRYAMITRFSADNLMCNPESRVPIAESISLDLKEQNTHPFFNASMREPHNSSMHISVFYGTPGQLVLSETIQSPRCRMFFPNSSQDDLTEIHNESAFGQKYIFQIALPKVDKCPADINLEQRCLITEMLKKMIKGIVITNKDTRIYVEQMCSIDIALTDGVTDRVPLERDCNSLAFSYKVFCTESEECHDGRRQYLPKPYFILTVGQETKQNQLNPSDNPLIYIVVSHDLATRISRDKYSTVNSDFLYSLGSSGDFLLRGLKKMEI